MTRRSRRRGRRDIGLLIAVAVLAILVPVTAAAEVAEHLILLAAAAGIFVAAFVAGRRWERRRPGKLRRSARAPAVPSQPQTVPPTWPLPAVPAVADQVAELERLAGRPIEAIIASYQVIQRRYGARP
jgi:hypothetical protein